MNLPIISKKKYQKLKDNFKIVNLERIKLSKKNVELQEKCQRLNQEIQDYKKIIDELKKRQETENEKNNKKNSSKIYGKCKKCGKFFSTTNSKRVHCNSCINKKKSRKEIKNG